MNSRMLVAVTLAAVAAVPAVADRLILAPTGNVLNKGDFRAEVSLQTSPDDNRIFWLNAGLPRFELNLTQFDQRSTPGSEDTTLFGAEFAMLPETSLTPGIGVGAYDITGQTPDGVGFYLAFTKAVPFDEKVPYLPLSDIKLTLGYGVKGIHSFFYGADAHLPLNLTIYAEHFQKHTNLGLGWTPLKGVQATAYRIDDGTYFGVQVFSVLE